MVRVKLNDVLLEKISGSKKLEVGFGNEWEELEARDLLQSMVVVPILKEVVEVVEEERSN